MGGWIALGVIAALLLLIVVWIVSTYNGLVRVRNNVDESFSTMDVCMKKRYDLVPNLVNTVKGYTKHESETLKAVIEARNAALGAKTPEDQAKAESQLSGSLKSLFALAESYPDLKANSNFVDLQAQLKTLETEIANSRRYYNACVKEYNTKLQVFPSNIVARWFKFKTREMFQLDSPEERKNVKVEF